MIVRRERRESQLVLSNWQSRGPSCLPGAPARLPAKFHVSEGVASILDCFWIKQLNVHVYGCMCKI